ncbi:MAG: hypothetical protein ACXVCK_21865 [Bdellovibrionota bacterium]
MNSIFSFLERHIWIPLIPPFAYVALMIAMLRDFELCYEVRSYGWVGLAPMAISLMALAILVFRRREALPRWGALAVCVGSVLILYKLGITDFAGGGNYASLSMTCGFPAALLAMGLYVLARPRSLRYFYLTAHFYSVLVSASVFYITVFGQSDCVVVGRPRRRRFPYDPGDSTAPSWGGGGWSRAAAEEHASISSFADLVSALVETGAPPALLRGAHAAMADEIRHTEMAMARGKALPGARWGKWLRCQRLKRLAAESFLDGCLNEGAAAVKLERAGLAAVAADERNHAELGWQVFEWCLSELTAAQASQIRKAALLEARGEGAVKAAARERLQACR